MSLPCGFSGSRKSILSRTLFAMVSTSRSLLTARWVMRSVGMKFTLCLLKIGGSSSSFICMNPVVLCKIHISKNNHVTITAHKTYMKNHETGILSDIGLIRRIMWNWCKTLIGKSQGKTTHGWLRHTWMNVVREEGEKLLSLTDKVCHGARSEVVLLKMQDFWDGTVCQFLDCPPWRWRHSGTSKHCELLTYQKP